MTNDLLDDDHLSNPDSWDSKTRIKISDAIIEVNDHVKKVKNGRWGLVILAVLNILGAIYLYFSGGLDEAPELIPFIMGATLVLLAPYVLGAIFYNKNPMLWLIAGLSVYILSVILNSVGGEGVINGFVWKILIIVSFCYEIYSASEWKKNLNKLRELGYSRSAVESARKNLTPIPRLRRKPKPAAN
ncbi:MAG: hypothetical protein AAF597_18155 [Bacteroidota bacterium]